MVRALFPTPPPPTTTSLNLSSSPLIFSPDQILSELTAGPQGRVKSRSRSKPASCKETPTWTVFKTEVWCANDGLGATPVKQSPDGVPLSTQHNNTHRRVCCELGLTAGLWQSPSPFLFFFRLFSRRPPVSFWAELLPLFSFLKKLQQQLHHTDVRGGGDFPHARTNTRQPSSAAN